MTVSVLLTALLRPPVVCQVKSRLWSSRPHPSLTVLAKLPPGRYAHTHHSSYSTTGRPHPLPWASAFLAPLLSPPSLLLCQGRPSLASSLISDLPAHSLWPPRLCSEHSLHLALVCLNRWLCICEEAAPSCVAHLRGPQVS